MVGIKESDWSDSQSGNSMFSSSGHTSSSTCTEQDRIADAHYNPDPSPILRPTTGMIRSYSYISSTEENWRALPGDFEFYGPFKDLRATLDYSYHCNYRKERQNFQDEVIEKMLGSFIRDKNGFVCTIPRDPWIVFTAGAMGAGKSHTIRKLQEANHFPLLAFVSVDPDEIRRELPEFLEYVHTNPLLAGEMTRKEAGYIAELITLAALRKGKNVLVDGSLRDTEWYSFYFSSLREEYSNLRIAILHITAPPYLIFHRAKTRAQETGREVPIETIIKSMEQVPQSVAVLSPLSDYHAELNNAGDEIELVYPIGETWQMFTEKWSQTCAFTPKHNPILYTVLDVATRQKIEDASLTKDCIRKLSISIESDDATTATSDICFSTKTSQ